MGTKSLEKLRPLGGLERYFATWHHLNFYYNIGITGYYVLPPFSSVSVEQTIYAALALVIAKHPILSTVILGDSTSSPYFAHLPSFDLQDVVTIVERKRAYPSGDGRDIELDKLLETPHNEAFENDGNEPICPLWRLLVLTNPNVGSDHAFTASFVFHHSISDAASGLNFHKRFLEALNEAPQPLKSAVIRSPCTPLPPPLENLLSLPVTVKRLMRTFFETRFQSLPRGVWAGAPVALPPKAANRRFMSVTLSPDVTTAFVALCKSNGTTLQATLEVLAAQCMFGILPEKFKRLDFTIAVSLRRFLDEDKVEEDGFGTFNSSAFDHFERDNFGTDGFRWNEAHRARDVLASHLELKGKDEVVGLLKYIRNNEKFCWDKVGKPRWAAVEISNIGAFHKVKEGRKEDIREDEKQDLDESEWEEGESWKMGRMVFSQSAGVMSAAISVSVITGGDGGLTLGFAWLKGVVDRDVVVKLMRNMQQGIHELALPDD
ncbi:alcohol acetyltransferase [Bisporella sp. PMI_857]|nr:alcohol acetyltransferase [Bisporella sp. PMI_857]